MFTAITFVMFAVGVAGCGYCAESWLSTGEDHAVLFALYLIVAALSFGELREAVGRKVGEASEG